MNVRDGFGMGMCEMIADMKPHASGNTSGDSGDFSGVRRIRNYNDLKSMCMGDGEPCKSVSDCCADADQEVICCMAGKCASDKACYRK